MAVRNQRLGLCLLCEQVLKVAELALQNLVLCTQGGVIEFQLIVLLEYAILRELKQILLSLLLLP